MGNQFTQPSRFAAAEAIAELGGSVTLKDNLGGSRLFKTLLCVHDDGGLVVVKLYVKSDDSPELRQYREQLLSMHANLAGLDFPHAWPVQQVFESERAAFLMRQYVHTNLVQRITTRPFLTLVEKRWIAYQLLLALAQCHSRGVCHGDIKAENVALTSWDWAFLVDFAPYKPAALPADNPAHFSLFFDTTGRRKCCLAPERFYDPAAVSQQQAANAALTPAMDVFSLGCVLAELFLDGQPLFDYSRLLAYRNHGVESGVLAPLLKVHHTVRGMVAHMLHHDPSHRHSVHQYLQEASAVAMPPWMAATMHPFFASMLHLDPDARLARASREYGHVKEQLLGSSTANCCSKGAAEGDQQAAPAESVAAILPGNQHLAENMEGDGSSRLCRAFQDQAIGMQLSDVQTLMKQLEGRRIDGNPHLLLHRSSPKETPAEQPPSALEQNRDACAASTSDDAVMPLAVSHNCHDQQRQQQQDAAGTKQHEGMVLVAVLLCTLLRGCRLQEHKAHVVRLLHDAATHCDDETRLQRVLPFLVAATAEPLAAVKAVALQALTSVLAQVHGVPPSEAKVFNEYVLPSLSLLPSDAELVVQVEYASCIALLASTAQSFLEQLQRRRLQAAVGFISRGSPNVPALNYDDEMAHLRAGVERVVHDLLVGPSNATKLSLLPHLERLAAFVGRRDTADVLLPSLLTFFNSQSWQVRAAFYAAFPGVCPGLGPEGVAAIAMAFLDRLLGDPDAAVAAEAIGFLAAMARSGLLLKRHLLKVAAQLCNRQLLAPSAPVVLRAAAVELVAAAAGEMSTADSHSQLLPLVLPQLNAEPLDLKDPKQILRVLNHCSNGSNRTGAGVRRVAPKRMPLPGNPAAPLVPASQRWGPGEGGDTVGNHCSLELFAASGASREPSAAAGGVSSNLVVGASGDAVTQAPEASQVSSRSKLLLQPALCSYSLQVDPRFLNNASSYLSAAIEQSTMTQAGVSVHMVVSSGSSSKQRGGGTRRQLHTSTQWAALDSGQQLVAHSRRNLPQPAGVAQQVQMPDLAASTAKTFLSPGVESSVRDAMSAALAVDLPGGLGAARNVPPEEPWYPRGVLVAHLAEHKKPVNRLAISGCGAFFVSASSDETVKVWDCRRLEKDVSFRSRLTYTAQPGRITSVAACQDSQSLASGSAAGSIHVWRVEYVSRTGCTPERYTGIVGCRQVAPNGSAVLDLAACGPSLLLYSTQQAGLAAWDLRVGRDAWSLPTSPAAGVVQRFVLDPHSQSWLLGATSRGHLLLWDLRFCLPLTCWQHPAGGPISALAPASAPLQRLGLSAAGGPLVYVVAGEREVGLWDVAEAKCRQVLRVSPNSEAAQRQQPSALATPFGALGVAPRGADMMSRARQLAISELQAPAARMRRDCFHALLPTAGGQLLVGGTDCAIRCWDTGRPEQSYVVCAPPPSTAATPSASPAASAPTAADEAAVGGAPVLAGVEATPPAATEVPEHSYITRVVQGVPVLEESCTLHRSYSMAAASGADREQHLARMGWAERAAALCHQLGINDLLRADASEPLLLSAGADGTIKAWR